MVKKIFKINGMHCSSCAMDIDGELEDTAGVEEANTNYAKQLAEVLFDPDKVSEEKIRSIIKDLGYKVADSPK